MSGVVLVTLTLLVVLAPPAVLTAVGAQRRGARPGLTVVAGLAFPVTWAVWYIRDEHPYTRQL